MRTPHAKALAARLTEHARPFVAVLVAHPVLRTIDLQQRIAARAAWAVLNSPRGLHFSNSLLRRHISPYSKDLGGATVLNIRYGDVE